MAGLFRRRGADPAANVCGQRNYFELNPNVSDTVSPTKNLYTLIGCAKMLRRSRFLSCSFGPV